MTCRLRRWSKLKREVEFQARLFFQTGNNSISSVDEVQLLHAYSEALWVARFLAAKYGRLLYIHDVRQGQYDDMYMFVCSGLE